MNKNYFDKEDIYDREIVTLVTELEMACTAHELPFVIGIQFAHTDSADGLAACGFVTDASMPVIDAAVALLKAAREDPELALKMTTSIGLILATHTHKEQDNE